MVIRIVFTSRTACFHQKPFSLLSIFTLFADSLSPRKKMWVMGSFEGIKSDMKERRGAFLHPLKQVVSCAEIG